jgi:uncharacterized protein (TIGR03437 family)
VDRDQVPTSKISPVGVPLDPDPSLSWQFSMFGASTDPVPWPNVSMGSSLDYSYYQPNHLAFVGNEEWQAWSVYGSSNDNGQTWTAFPSVPSELLWSNGAQLRAQPIGGAIAMSSTNPLNMVWAPTWGTFDGDFDSASGANSPWPHYTTDGGNTWNLCLLANPPPKPNPYNLQDNNDTHYNTLPKSWSNIINPYVAPVIVAADRNDPSGKTFYYFDGTYFYYSTDGGATWTPSSTTGFPSYIVSITITSNPAAYGDVWLSFGRNSTDVGGYPLYHSTNGGNSFSVVPGLTYCDKITFGMGNSPTTPFIYVIGRIAGATQDAIYQSQDGAQTWIRISDSATDPLHNVSQIEGDMRTPNLLYMAMIGRGIIYGELPAAPPAQPVFPSNGVVNAGGYTPLLAPGSVSNIFGTSLAPAVAAASSLPLPVNLNGVLVTVNDEAAPLWYVSPGQINFQMPWDAPLSGTVQVLVYNGRGVSNPVTVPVTGDAFGVFEYYDSAGTVEGVITHADYTLITASHPASAGETIVLWGTGFGNIAGMAPQSGFPSMGGNTETNPVTVSLSGASPTVSYSALTQGSVGLGQMNVVLPATLPAGNPLSLTVTVGGNTSPPVPLWVQ